MEGRIRLHPRLGISLLGGINRLSQIFECTGIIAGHGLGRTREHVSIEQISRSHASLSSLVVSSETVNRLLSPRRTNPSVSSRRRASRMGVTHPDFCASRFSDSCAFAGS